MDEEIHLSPQIERALQEVLDNANDSSLERLLRWILNFDYPFSPTDAKPQRPKDCGCGDTDSMGSYNNFRDKEKMLCYLNCYNGGDEVNLYRQAAQRGTRLELFHTAYIGLLGNSGFFSAAGSPVANVSNDKDTTLRLQEIYGFDGRVTDGGLIFIRDAQNVGSRADVLATLVEEIHHAAHYHHIINGIRPCGEITRLETEAFAKAAQFAWIARSGINPSDFELTLRQARKVQDEVANYGGLSNLAFGITDPRSETYCPGETAPTVTKVAFFSCLDPLVRRSIRV